MSQNMKKAKINRKACRCSQIDIHKAQSEREMIDIAKPFVLYIDNV